MDERYKGVSEHDVSGEAIADIYERGWLEYDGAFDTETRLIHRSDAEKSGAV